MISDNHADYAKYKPAWDRCKDSVAGSDAIKAATTKYLPMLPAMNAVPEGAQLYSLYLDNALWYSGTGRTFKAYLGTLFRKESVTEVPGGLDPAKEVFTPDGQTIDGFSARLAGEVIKGYRPGILIDYPDVNTDGMTKAQAEAAGARPYAMLYPADMIVNWGQRVIGGHLQTVSVVVEERMPVSKANEKAAKDWAVSDGYVTFRRHLELISTELGLAYRMSLYGLVDNKGDSEYVLIERRTPTMNGGPLSFIPFIPVTTAGLVWDLNYPLINEIAVLNIADYRNEALYRDALLFNGRPTPCVSGLIVENGQKSVTLGSTSILQFQPDGKWGVLGGGADAAGLKDAGVDLKNQMALVGSRALAEDPRGVEAAETAAIHRQGEDGVLSSVATAVSAGTTRALEIMGKWWGVDGDVLYTVNSDFIPGDVDAARLTAIWNMYVRGDISYNTYFSYLQRGEIYPDGWTIEKEEEAIAEDLEKIGQPEPLPNEDTADTSPFTD